MKSLHMFKSWRNVVLLIVLSLLWLGGIDQTASAENAIVNFDIINVRSGPDISCEIIGNLYNNTSVDILGRNNGWIQISSGNLNGWIAETLTNQYPSTTQIAPIQVYINDQLSLDIDPISVNGCTLVPLRAILNNLGAAITWDNSSQTITVRKSATTITITVGSLTGTINGQIKSLDVPARIVNGRSFASLRFITEALGYKTTWDGENRKINVYCPSVTAEKITAVTITISATDVNIRNGPSTAYEVVGLTPNGTRLVCIGEKDGWYQVMYHGQSAWVAGWLSTEPATTEFYPNQGELKLLPVPSTNYDFVAQMKPYAEIASKGTGLPVSFLLAQWAEESGFGTSALAQYYNNFGGIKDPNTGGFKRYLTVEEFAQDVINLYTQHSNYDQLLAHARAGLPIQTLIYDLTTCHYASSSNYGQKIKNVYLPEIDAALAAMK